jgi:DNA-binding SARP family transcriptional activator/TolB-like protein
MIELRTLGSVDLRTPDGNEVRSVLAQPKRLALLAYLAMAAPGGFVRRETLLAMFWPESDDERARASFRQAVRYLRRSLGEGVLVNRAEDELGIPTGVFRCDAVAFRAALERGDPAGALDLYQGDLLDGFFVADAPGFEAWLTAERAALRSAAAVAAWSLADTAETAGNPGGARARAGRAMDLEPLDEAGVCRWISLLDRLGDRTGAVRAYDEFERRLRSELDLEPSPETRALVAGIRAQRPPVANPAPTRPAVVVPETPASFGETLVPSAPRRPILSSSGWRPAAVAGLVVALALGWLAHGAFARSDESETNPRRVVVASFENRTGDAALDPVGRMAADWIIQGLSGRGALEVVPLAAVLASTDPRRLARELGAGTAVAGAYYRQGDSLYFQAQVTEAATGRVLAGVGPVGAPVETALEGVDRLQQRVLAALAPLSDDRDTHVRLARVPPSYDAYHAYVAGFESFVRLDFNTALRHFERSFASDSAFLLPAIAAGIMHSNLGNHAAADSLARRADRSRDQLNAFEAATLDMLMGWLRGDDQAAYEASVRQARIAPGSIGEYQVAEQARRLNRPAETVRVLTALGPERGELRGWFTYWRELTDANHMLGKHRAELRAARRARALHGPTPRVLHHEVKVLAALGRVGDVHARIQDRLASPSRDAPDPGSLMATAARELKAHGRPAEAAALYERSAAWYRSQPTGEGHEDHRPSLGRALYEAGEWEEARRLFQRLAEEDPDGLDHLGYLGVIAARVGDRAEAERYAGRLRELDRPYLRGIHTLWRARIAAVLGDREQAVALLQDAFSQGQRHGTDTHTDVDLESLRDYPPYQALVRPR